MMTKFKFLGEQINNEVITNEDMNRESCEKGKVVKYLRTPGLMLDSANRIDLKTYNLDACINACTNNIVCSFQLFNFNTS